VGEDCAGFYGGDDRGDDRFHEWIGDSWAILFSHPKDFTPVCTTELGYVAKIGPEFDKRGGVRSGLGVDKAESHQRWAADIEEAQGTALCFPVIADADPEGGASLRSSIHPAGERHLHASVQSSSSGRIRRSGGGHLSGQHRAATSTRSCGLIDSSPV
jgi:peroxiredoxin